MEKRDEVTKGYRKCGEELVYQGAAVAFYKERIQLPDGRVVEWDLIQHPGGAAILPIDAQGNLLFVEQYRNSMDRVVLEIPAGKREPGEPFARCAARELEEETGYRSSHLVFMGESIPAIGYSNEVLGLFYADHLEKTAQYLDDDEWIQVVRMPLEQAVDRVMDGHITDSKTVSAVLMYARICNHS